MKLRGLLRLIRSTGGLITGTTAVTVRLIGAAVGPVGFFTVAVDEMTHWSDQPAPTGAPSILPPHVTVPLAYVLAIYFGLGPRGVFLAVTIAFSALAVVSALIFRRGRWKTRRV